VSSKDGTILVAICVTKWKDKSRTTGQRQIVVIIKKVPVSHFERLNGSIFSENMKNMEK